MASPDEPVVAQRPQAQIRLQGRLRNSQATAPNIACDGHVRFEASQP